MAMRPMIPLILVLLAVLAACDRSGGLYADRSIPVVAPSASADTPPRFIGRWAASSQCKDPWVVAARSLEAGEVNCEFARVQATPAGYSVASVCRTKAGPMPGRLNMILLPDPERATEMTVSGGPFSDAVALQRCAAHP